MESKDRKECLTEADMLKVTKVSEIALTWFLQNLRHPNIVQCYDVFTENNELILVLELAE